MAEAVRNLALKSAQSAKEISTLLNANIENIEKSEGMAEASSKVLESIHKSVEKVHVLNNEIADASENQYCDIGSLKSNVEQLLALMENVNSYATDLNGSSTDLFKDAKGLNELIQKISDSEGQAA